MTIDEAKAELEKVLIVMETQKELIRKLESESNQISAALQEARDKRIKMDRQLNDSLNCYSNRLMEKEKGK